MFGNIVHRVRPAMLATVALLASSCDRHPAGAASPPPPAQAAAPAPSGESRAWFTPSPQQAPGVRLAYSHSIGLQVGGGALRAHFSAARDRCLNTAALHCLLLEASFNAPAGAPGGTAPQSAEMRVRLPHDQVAPFANALTERLPGEPAGLVRIVRQSTTAEDLSRPTADVAQRVTQLTDYLSSLKALGARLTISVSDLVTIARETAQAQSQIESVQAEQRDLAQRVDTEELAIAFEETPSLPAAAQDPVVETWSHAGTIFRQSVAEALDVGIQAIPWLPFALAGVVLLALLRLAIFGRRHRPPAVVVPAATPTPAVRKEPLPPRA